MRPPLLLALLIAAPLLSHADAVLPGFGPADLSRIADLTEPVFSPDGEWVAYTVTSANLAADRAQSDLWRVRYADARDHSQVTSTPEHDEWRPQWSPDGKTLAFLSDRGDDEATTQVWSLPSSGGEARRLTNLPGGVDDYAWSPDGTRLALIATDPEWPEGSGKPQQPAPIVIDRYLFKEDGIGYLGSRRRHLYLFDLASGRADLLTPGNHDEHLPAWSPDGRQIAYVSRREEEPDRHLNYDLYIVEARAGAPERRLTSFPGSDLDPYWESRPAWSPDGRRIAYLRSGEDRWIYYAPWQLAVVDVASGAERIPAPIDRCMSRPRWSADGRSVYALVEQSRVTNLSRIELATGRVTPLTGGNRFDYDFDLAGRRGEPRLVVLGGDDLRPYGLAAVERGGSLRPLDTHNDWLAAERWLAPVEVIRFPSRDGTPIEGFLVRPLDYVAGRRYPTILRLHGGPVYQFSHEFMPEWQAFAAAGFAVVAVNPRGSSGRGFDFARSIFANWGQLDVVDALAAVDHVVAMGVADPERLGVGGRSYGGMLTNYVIATDTRFKAATSGAGASNMLAMYGHDQYVREYELELGTPWANRDAYERVSYPFLHADRIRTPTLFYCAADDWNVPCLGSEQMYQALRSLGIPTQLVIYPGESHGLTVPSYLRDRLERHLAWYTRFLAAPPSP